jgi:predicted phosphodiesterase
MEKKKNTFPLIYSIGLLVFTIALTYTLGLAYSIFRGELADYMTGVYLLIGLIVLFIIAAIYNIFSLIQKMKKIDTSKKQQTEIDEEGSSQQDDTSTDKENQEISKKKTIGLFITVVWHFLLGILFLGGIIYALIELYSDIKGNYVPLAIGLGIALVGFGLAFLTNSLKLLKGKIKKKQIVKSLPGIKVIGLIFFLIFPIGGMYYLVDFYLPVQQYYQPMDRGPLLSWRNDSSNSMTIGWDSVEAKSFKVKWGNTSGSLLNEGTPESYPIYSPTKGEWGTTKQIGTHYFYEISNLTADTKYYYKIEGFSQEKTFKTSPLTTKPFSFQVLGDNRNSDGRHRTLVELMNTYSSEFTINVGDVVNWDKDFEWNEYFDDIRDQADTKPYLIAPGNHESSDEFGYYFSYKYSPDNFYFSYNYSNVHVLIIDTTNVDKDQLEFIEADLKRNSGKHDWTFAAFHHPFYSTGGHNYDANKESQLMGNLTKYGVDVVFTGHDHHYESFNVSRAILEQKWGTYGGNSGNGMLHFVSGGGGVSLRSTMLDREIDPWLTETQNSSENRVYQTYFPLEAKNAAEANYTVADILVYAEITYQFMQMDINGPNLNITTIRLDGTTTESFQISK